MRLFECILLLCLIMCAVSVAFARDLLTSIIIFMSYSLIMCVIWMILQSPDLAITEAAVGAGLELNAEGPITKSFSFFWREGHCFILFLL